MSTLVYILIYSVAVWLMLTHHPELRAWRKVRIVASVAVLVGSAFLVRHLVRSFGPLAGSILWLPIFISALHLLAVLWSPVIAHQIGLVVSNIVLPFELLPNSPGGFRTDFSLARSLIRTENWRQARRIIEEELKKDPSSYEGRILLAHVYQCTGRRLRAIQQIDIVLGDPASTEGQKQFARHFREEFLTFTCWFNLFYRADPAEKKPPVKPRDERIVLVNDIRSPGQPPLFTPAKGSQNNESAFDRRLNFLSRTGNVSALFNLAAQGAISLHTYDHLRLMVHGLTQYGDPASLERILEKAAPILYLPELLTDALQSVRGSNQAMIQCLIAHGADATSACRKLRSNAAPDTVEWDRMHRLAQEIEEVHRAMQCR